MAQLVAFGLESMILITRFSSRAGMTAGSNMIWGTDWGSDVQLGKLLMMVLVGGSLIAASITLFSHCLISLYFAKYSEGAGSAIDFRLSSESSGQPSENHRPDNALSLAHIEPHFEHQNRSSVRRLILMTPKSVVGQTESSCRQPCFLDFDVNGTPVKGGSIIRRQFR